MEDNKVKLTQGQDSMLIYGIVYIILLALLIWLIYGFRTIQITQANSKINSIKKEISGQVSEDDLAQLETISAQMSVLYGKPLMTALLKDIASSTPKNIVLTNVGYSGSEVAIQGFAPSYAEISLFIAALNQKGGYLENAEISNAFQSDLEGQGVSFTLEANLK